MNDAPLYIIMVFGIDKLTLNIGNDLGINKTKMISSIRSKNKKNPGWAIIAGQKISQEKWERKPLKKEMDNHMT